MSFAATFTHGKTGYEPFELVTVQQQFAATGVKGDNEKWLVRFIFGGTGNGSRTCLVQTFGRAGANLGREVGGNR